MITKEDVIIAKNNVDSDVKNFTDRLKLYKPCLYDLNLFNVFVFFSHKEIDEIFRKDEEIRKCFEKAMQSQGEFISIMKKMEL